MSLNKTEPMPPSLILCLFDIEVFQENWGDPYDSVWLKIATICIYAVDVLSSMVMLTFVSFEIQGLFGHYRTLINQLLSFLYGGVCKLAHSFLLMIEAMIICMNSRGKLFLELCFTTFLPD